MKSNRPTVHILSNTHWDREWRYSFQETKMDLVHMVDALLDLLEKNPQYRAFHFDSQTVALEDYLDVKPQRRAELERHIRSGRLLVGPWYSLPDEFLVGGESLVRNLLYGHRVARSFGRVTKVGYSPFSFNGRNSQMAQILRGFGIDTILFYRGITDRVAPAEYHLEASDGSRVLGFRFVPCGRINFLFWVGRPVLFNRVSGLAGGHPYAWSEGGIPFRLYDPEFRNQCYHLLAPLRHYRSDQLEASFRHMIGEIKTRTLSQQWMAWDGYDNSWAAAETPRMIRELRPLFKEGRIVQSTLPEFVGAVKKDLVGRKLPVVRGEVREPETVFQATLSARVDSKQMNRRVEAALAETAEPLSALAWLAGAAYPAVFLEKGWKTLLANHSHDSIGGCSLDAVERTVKGRQREILGLTDGLIRRSLGYLSLQIANPDSPYNVLVFNATPYARQESVELSLDFPVEAKVRTFRIEDPSGKPVAYTIRHREIYTSSVEQEGEIHLFTKADRFQVLLNAVEVPPCGWTTLRVIPGGRPPALPVPAASPRDRMENEHLRVRIARDGSFDLYDKATRRSYRRLHVLEDSGEAGGPWVRQVPERDRIITSAGRPARVEQVEDSPLRSVRRIHYTLRLPAALAPDRKGRAARLVPVQVVTDLILDRGSRQLDVITRVHNTVQEHRLRVLFETGVATRTVSAGSAFDVVSRGRRRAAPTEDPQHDFVDVSDRQGGLAILNQGLLEYEWIPARRSTVALTLLRTFHVLKMIATNIDVPEADLLGEHVFRYALRPHAGSWFSADIPARARAFNVPLRVAQCAATQGRQPPRQSMLGFSAPGLVVSAIKKAEDRPTLLVRLYNPSRQTVRSTLQLAVPVRKAWQTDLEEIRQGALPVRGGRVALQVPKGRILTVEMDTGLRA